MGGRDPGDLDALGLSGRTVGRLFLGFVALGIGLRLLVYLLRMPIWTDEGKLVVSLLDRGYAGLVEPLAYGQVAPFLFMWIEATAVSLFGFSELSLRLFPTIASIASVLLMGHVAKRVFTGWPLLFSVALFAVSYYPIRHGAEAKPYASDLLVSLALTAVAVEWLHEPRRARFLWWLALLAPVAVLLSYPAVFTACGIFAALALPVWRGRGASSRLALGTGALLTVGTFAASYLLITREAYERSHTKPWVDGFPSWDDPLGALLWVGRAHTGRTFGYPLGGDDGASILTFMAFAAGAIALLRARRGPLLALLLAPFAMGIGGAILHRYPYGGSGRVTQYLVPAICLLAGLGAARLASLPKRTENRLRAHAGVLAFLALFGVVLGVAAIVRPYRDLPDRIARDFTRGLWQDKGGHAVLLDGWEDLRLEFARPDDRVWLPGGEGYRVNQRIYRPANGRTAPPDLSSVSAARPLRVVLLDSVVRSNPEEVEVWIRDMGARYELAGRDHYRLGPFREQHGREDSIDVFTFVPARP